jgi:hypothetical protein
LCKRYFSRGFTPETPPKNLLQKVLWNLQNLWEVLEGLDSIRGSTPETPLKDFLKKVLKNPKNF